MEKTWVCTYMHLKLCEIRKIYILPLINSKHGISSQSSGREMYSMA